MRSLPANVRRWLHARTPKHFAAREVGRVLAKSGRQIGLMLLLLTEDLADVFADRVLAKRLALRTRSRYARMVLFSF